MELGNKRYSFLQNNLTRQDTSIRKHELPRAYGTVYSPEFSPYWPFLFKVDKSLAGTLVPIKESRMQHENFWIGPNQVHSFISDTVR